MTAVIVPKAQTAQEVAPLTYTKEHCQNVLRMLDSARTYAKKHPDTYDSQTIADLDARIKMWAMRLTELTLSA